MTPMIHAQHDYPDEQEPGLSARRPTTRPSVEIHVLQGERPMAADNKSLGRFILDGILPAPRGVPQVEVTFDIDANGIVNVSAQGQGDRQGAEDHDHGSSSGLSKDEVEKLQREAECTRRGPGKRREEIEARNNADNLAYQAEKTLRENGDKVPPTSRARSRGRSRPCGRRCEGPTPPPSDRQRRSWQLAAEDRRRRSTPPRALRWRRLDQWHGADRPAARGGHGRGRVPRGLGLHSKQPIQVPRPIFGGGFCLALEKRSAGSKWESAPGE